MTPDPRLEQIRAKMAQVKAAWPSMHSVDLRANVSVDDLVYLLAMIDTLQRERDEWKNAYHAQEKGDEQTY